MDRKRKIPGLGRFEPRSSGCVTTAQPLAPKTLSCTKCLRVDQVGSFLELESRSSENIRFKLIFETVNCYTGPLEGPRLVALYEEAASTMIFYSLVNFVNNGTHSPFE